MITSPLFEGMDAAQTSHEIKRILKDTSFPLVEESLVTFVFLGQADHVELRHWIYGLPSNLPLTRLGDTDVWYRTMEFPAKSRIEYKYRVVKHGHEEWIFDPLNPQVAYDPFGGNSVVHCHGYVDPEWSYENSDVSKGRFETVEIQSKSFGDTRKVRVYIPAGYRDYRRYRLMVVHDGDDYLRYSNLSYVLDNLIARNEIAPLVVALSNPHDRLREYADDPRHAAHVVEEVVPALENRFSLIGEASGRCIMGASFGGVASLSTAWRYPDIFDSMLLQSGSFAFTDIGDHSRSPAFDPVVEFMNQFRKNPGMPSKQAFVSCGVYESLIYENRSLVPFLRSMGIRAKFVESYDGHNWENWRNRLRAGLTWLFPGPLWVTYR